MFRTRRDALKAGWFSRRHQTNEAHREAQNQRRIKAQHKQNLVDNQIASTLFRKKKG